MIAKLLRMSDEDERYWAELYRPVMIVTTIVCLIGIVYAMLVLRAAEEAAKTAQ